MRQATKREAERYLAKKKLREDAMKQQRKVNLKIIGIFLIFCFTLLSLYYMM